MTPKKKKKRNVRKTTLWPPCHHVYLYFCFTQHCFLNSLYTGTLSKNKNNIVILFYLVFLALSYYQHLHLFLCRTTPPFLQLCFACSSAFLAPPLVFPSAVFKWRQISCFLPFLVTRVPCWHCKSSSVCQNQWPQMDWIETNYRFAHVCSRTLTHENTCTNLYIYIYISLGCFTYKKKVL